MPSLRSWLPTWLGGTAGQRESRVIFLGLDAAGKTTLLYKLKLGDIVTTIPTIGFNVETVECSGLRIIAWDVGGCDKIRPIWRHYTSGASGLVFIVDSNDRDRMEAARDELRLALQDETLHGLPVLVFANKQDLPSALPPSDVARLLGLAPTPGQGDASSRSAELSGRDVMVMPACVLHGTGTREGMDWLAAAIRRHEDGERAAPPTAAPATHTTAALPVGPPTPEARLLAWLSEPLDPADTDDAFLAQLEDCTLQRWDHFAHLRLAYLYLVRYGRAEGQQRAFTGIEEYIRRGPAAQGRGGGGGGGRTFHVTMTLFWIHMVDFALAKSQLQEVRHSFRAFLLANPHLADGGLFLRHYSKQRLLHDPAARSHVVLPDVAPLPSLVTDVERLKRLQQRRMAAVHGSGAVPHKEAWPLSDDELLDAVLGSTSSSAGGGADGSSADGSGHVARRLTGWGHDTLLRVASAAIRRFGYAKAQQVLQEAATSRRASTGVECKGSLLGMQAEELRALVRAVAAQMAPHVGYAVKASAEEDGGAAGHGGGCSDEEEDAALEAHLAAGADAAGAQQLHSYRELCRAGEV